MKKNKKCIDCGKKITFYAKWRCWKCYKKNCRGKNHHRYIGYKKQQGYIYVLKPSHPFCNCRGYIAKHRLLMENYLRENNLKSEYLIKVKKELYLNPKYIVHHKNKIRDDNRIKNLEIKTKSKHASDHRRTKKTKKQIREERKIIYQKYYQKNKEKISRHKKYYYNSHKQKYADRQREYLKKQEVKERKRKYDREYKRQKRQEERKCGKN